MFENISNKIFSSYFFFFITFFYGVSYYFTMNSLVDRIDSQVKHRSLLKHPFYQMWSDGKLTVDHLRGYSKEYFQLVKSVPGFIKNISSFVIDESLKKQIQENQREESEHIEAWIMFAHSLGVSRSELVNYNSKEKTTEAVESIYGLTESSFEEGVAAMYAFELELPKISRSKLDGLNKYYDINGKEATNYFEIHEEADVRHASLWRSILEMIPLERQQKVFEAAVKSIEAQNHLLDSVSENYAVVNCKGSA